jgi:hypothetical protein
VKVLNNKKEEKQTKQKRDHEDQVQKLTDPSRQHNGWA